MSKNDYLAKQRFSQQFFLDTGVQMGFQKCWGYIQLVLRDPEVMGKDTFGRKRIEKVYHAMMAMDKLCGPAHTTQVEADVLQEKLDANLREIWGKDLTPYRERYPFIKQPGYDKSRKGWR